MDKKIAVITGASSGIGKYLSIILSEKFHIFLIARNSEKLQKIADLITSRKNSCTIIKADISKLEDIKIIEDRLKDLNIDILINNAGFGIFNKILDISVNEWKNHMNTNLTGAFLMSKIVLKNMIIKKEGKIVFINSVAGKKAYPFSSAYVSSKFGLTGFASSLREELRQDNIKVISIHPGSIDTPFWDNINVDFPKNQMLSSEDVAQTIVKAILAPNNLVCEELVIRRTAGDF